MRTLESNDRTEAAPDAAATPRLVGDSPAMRKLLMTVARVAPKDVTVLVRGETGTGKELIASMIHAQSARKSAPLVRFNCAAIPSELAEAELFGHVRGAFTGADRSHAGFFAAADGGTVVLDEIGELPLAMQAKLLRVLQDGEIQQVGASRVERVDVRVIASTNCDLAAEVRRGRFREDLYYRLAVIELVVPPLRQRRQDIPALAVEFARRHASRLGKPEARLSAELLEELTRRDWPGNVRELENAIIRTLALDDGDSELGQQALPAEAGAVEELVAEVPASGSNLSLREQIDSIERGILVRTLASVSGNQSEAARRLRLSRTSLIDRMKKHGLDGSGRVPIGSETAAARAAA